MVRDILSHFHTTLNFIFVRYSCIYKLGGPKTFRRSSTKILARWGNNLQNVEKSGRALYIPDGPFMEHTGKCKYWLETGDISVFTQENLNKLRVMIQSDQSGAEDLVVSYDTDAAASRDCYIYGIKKHCYVAMRLFDYVWKNKLKESGGLIEDFNIEELCNTPIKDIKQNPFWHDLNVLLKKSDEWIPSERYYYFAKQTVHSSNYGIEANTFRMNVLEKSNGKVVIPMNEARRFLETYRSLFPEIPERNRRVERQVRECRILFNHFGHPYQITDYNLSDSKMKEYFAWTPQSTVGEITRIAFTNLQNWIWDNNKQWDVLQDNHDSYLAQCPLQDVRECRDKMKEFMNIELISPVDNKKYRMKSEQNIGFNWSPYKEGKNVLGLREVSWLN